MNGLDSLTLDDTNQPLKERKGKEVKVDEYCAGYQALSAIVQSIQQQLEWQREDNKCRLSRLEESTEALRQSTEALKKEFEKMRKARQWIIIEQVKERAVQKLGKVVSEGESWSAFFSTHATETKALGISDLLFSLVAEGKKVLHKTVQEAALFDLADAVLSLKENTLERQTFEAAFRFAFDEDASSYF